MASLQLRLFLFTPDPATAREAQDAGVHSVIIDWEHQGKRTRQAAHDTEVNLDSPEDLQCVARAVRIPVTVRVNGGSHALSDVEIALDRGARILMLPMAESAREVEMFLRAVNGRAETIVQIETQSLVDAIDDLSSLPWNYAFIGLNDLMISRGGMWLWEPLLDGTVESIFEALPGRQIGFGGVTVVGGGHPLPFTLLLREMAALGCGLSFLRRTFRKEIAGRDMAAELAAVRAAWDAALHRSPRTIAADRLEFRASLSELRPASASPLSAAGVA